MIKPRPSGFKKLGKLIKHEIHKAIMDGRKLHVIDKFMKGDLHLCEKHRKKE